MSYVPVQTRRRLKDFSETAVRDFDAEKWRLFGLATRSEDLILDHKGLIHGVAAGEGNQEEKVGAVFLEIVERDAANFFVIQDFIEANRRDVMLRASSATVKSRSITITSNVFDPPETGVDPTLVAVMMPFAADFDPVYAAIKLACTNTGLRCLRGNDIWNSSTVMQDVFALIFQAAVVVCDFSGRNPNVFYEAGIAHTLGKDIVPLSQSRDDIPFDVAHHRYLPYDADGEGLPRLTDALTSRLKTLTAGAVAS